MWLDAAQATDVELKGEPSSLEFGLASRYGVVPLAAQRDGPVLLATASEQGTEQQRELRFALKREVLFTRVTPERYDSLVASTWPAVDRQATQESGSSGPFRARLVSAAPAATAHEQGLLADLGQGTGVVEQVDRILSQAISLGASDIHFEPGEHDLRIRFRMDGVLQPALVVRQSRQSEMISRLKILAGMDIAEKRRPQDGRIAVDGAAKSVDVRVSSMPTPHGEKMVLRLLDKARQPLDLGALGMAGANLERFQDAITKPFGMILVTGPTGSGKTTTLYAALRTIHSPEINISTVEDPIEYLMAGINQTQMHAEIGYTFAAAVRTFLRQDPDVIMVGEIRDAETAKYAIQAAQTGHLVFSTLHTNDAPSAIIRLVEMGVEPFLVASTVHLIMAQRLVRRTCPQCGQVRPLTAPEQRYMADCEQPPSETFEGQGCQSCSSTGYRGRTGVYEIMQVTPEVQELVTQRTATEQIRRKALEQGMLSLKVDALRLVREHTTSVAEVRAVVG